MDLNDNSASVSDSPIGGGGGSGGVEAPKSGVANIFGFVKIWPKIQNIGLSQRTLNPRKRPFRSA